MRFMRRLLAFLLILLVLIFGVLFSIQNTATAPLDLLLFQLPEQRVALWILLAFALGGVTGVLISTIAIVQLKSHSLLLQRKLDKSRKELSGSQSAELRTTASNN